MDRDPSPSGTRSNLASHRASPPGSLSSPKLSNDIQQQSDPLTNEQLQLVQSQTTIVASPHLSAPKFSNGLGTTEQEQTEEQPEEQEPLIGEDSINVAKFCGLDGPNSISAYPVWSHLDSEFWRQVLSSLSVAILLQWGTSGAAIVLSYLTEVRGLGCRSGSYLLYAVLSTSSFLFLSSSAFLSHQTMLLYQTEFTKGRYRKNPKLIKDYTRRGYHALFATLTILTRVTGKLLAVLNTAWLIISSLWELIGFYDSCWCLGTTLQLRDRAWVVLFKTAIQLRESAEPSWAGGIAFSLMVGVICGGIIWNAKAETKDR